MTFVGFACLLPYITFDNQVATLDDLIQSDIVELKKKDKEIIHSTRRHVLMQVPKPSQEAKEGKRPRITKKVLAKAEDIEEGMACEANDMAAAVKHDHKNETRQSSSPGVTTSTFHELLILPDRGGELFQHSESKLRQLDIRDVDNELIAPQKWYDQLRRPGGTLVMIRATLHAFNWENRRVCDGASATSCMTDCVFRFTRSTHTPSGCWTSRNSA
jgi:hypothetical protein